MSKIIDITNKLNFEEKPIIKVKDVELEANHDAITILKVTAILDNEEKKMAISNILDIYNMLFDEDNQKKIEALKLSMDDFATLIVQSATLIINDGEEVEGETMTPAMT